MTNLNESFILIMPSKINIENWKQESCQFPSSVLASNNISVEKKNSEQPPYNLSKLMPLSTNT